MVAALADGFGRGIHDPVARTGTRFPSCSSSFYFANFRPTIPATGFRKPFDILSAVAQTTSNSPAVINIIQFILRLVKPFTTICSQSRLVKIPPERGEHERLHHRAVVHVPEDLITIQKMHGEAFVFVEVLVAIAFRLLA